MRGSAGRIMIRPGQAIMIVWLRWPDRFGGLGSSGLHDPAREVADLLLHPNQEDLLDFAAWQPFLSVYVESRRDDADFDQRLHGYLAVFPVFWLGILLGEGMRRIRGGDFDKWMINEMEPNARLRRYLARAQAWPEADPSVALAKLGDVAFF